jgi:hypothetical protein
MRKNSVARWSLSLAALILISCGCNLFATTYYWDTNGATAGSGAADGTWDSSVSALWTTDATGASATQAVTTVSTDSLIFSAGANGSAGTITVNGTQLAQYITISQSGLTFQGGAIGSSAATVSATIGASAIINSQFNGNFSFSNANQAVTLGGGGSFNGFLTGAGNSTAALNVTSGSYTLANTARFNFGSTSNPSATGVTIGSGVTFNAASNNTSWIGYGGDGVVKLAGGTWIQPTYGLAIGRGSTSALMIITSGSLISNAAQIDRGITVGAEGTSGNATLDMRGGVITTNYLNIGSIPNATSTRTALLVVSGGTTNADTLTLGNGYSGAAINGSGTLAISDGLVNIGTGGIVNGASTSGSFKASIVLSGGTLGSYNGASWGSAMDMTLATGSNGNVTFKPDTGKTVTLQGNLTGSGGLNVGGGTLILSGVNAYHGLTAISAAAVLQINGTQTIFLANLGGAAFSGLGQLQLNGTINFDFSSLTPTDGDSWTIFGSDLLGNITFNNANWLSGFTDQGGGIWSNGADYYFNQNNGVLSYNMIPEPSVLALFGTGMMVLTVSVLRYRRKA